MSRIQRVLKGLRPGLITGAVDNDPSGIATHSTTGAKFGFGQLWSYSRALKWMSPLFLITAVIGTTISPESRATGS